MKLILQIQNWFRDRDDRIAAAMADPVRDGKFAIEDARKEVDEFVGHIAELVTATKELEQKRDSAIAEVNKFEGFAKKAGGANDADGVREALQFRNKAQSNVTVFAAEIKENEEQADELKEQLKDLNDRIENAEGDQVQLAARIRSAALREKTARATAGVEGGHGLEALDDLKRAADKAEAKADAWKDVSKMTEKGGTDLDRKYGSGKEEVPDDEVSKYLTGQAVAGSHTPA